MADYYTYKKTEAANFTRKTFCQDNIGTGNTTRFAIIPLNTNSSNISGSNINVNITVS